MKKMTNAQVNGKKYAAMEYYDYLIGKPSPELKETIKIWEQQLKGGNNIINNFFKERTYQRLMRLLREEGIYLNK